MFFAAKSYFGLFWSYFGLFYSFLQYNRLLLLQKSCKIASKYHPK